MSDILRKSLIEMKSKKKEQTLRGTLLPIQWDENDRVVQIVLDTPGQVGYLIHPDGRGRELLQLLRQKVEVTGTLKADEAGDFVPRMLHDCAEKSTGSLRCVFASRVWSDDGSAGVRIV